jgi:glycerate 2-kinase
VRVLLAFDKFKDALTARQACEAAAAALTADNSSHVDLCPLSDGGDGFEATLGEALRARRVGVTVRGPRGEPVEASLSLAPAADIPGRARELLGLHAGIYASDRPVAIIDMASASGLALLPPERRDPWQTTSYGTGELIRRAQEFGAAAIILGVGGSATHDLGCGALAALGWAFPDNTGAILTPPTPARWHEIARISPPAQSTHIPLRLACDVANPLLGTNGAATIFGPQKGLTPERLRDLETATAQLARLLCEACGQPFARTAEPGAGAAGGMAFGLGCAMGATLISGAGLVAACLDLDTRIAAADIVLTGEGRFDASSLKGKGPGHVIEHALRLGKPVHVFAGQVSATPSQPHLQVHAITPKNLPLAEALRSTRELLSTCVVRVFRQYR